MFEGPTVLENNVQDSEFEYLAATKQEAAMANYDSNDWPTMTALTGQLWQHWLANYDSNNCQLKQRRDGNVMRCNSINLDCRLSFNIKGVKERCKDGMVWDDDDLPGDAAASYFLRLSQLLSQRTRGQN